MGTLAIDSVKGDLQANVEEVVDVEVQLKSNVSILIKLLIVRNISGPRGRGRGEGRGGRGGFGGENRGGFGGTEAPEGGGDIFQQADDNSWNANGGETQPRGGFASGAQANVERGGFGQSDGGGRGGFGTFGDEETERLSGARPPNRGGFGNR